MSQSFQSGAIRMTFLSPPNPPAGDRGRRSAEEGPDPLGVGRVFVGLSAERINHGITAPGGAGGWVGVRGCPALPTGEMPYLDRSG